MVRDDTRLGALQPTRLRALTRTAHRPRGRLSSRRRAVDPSTREVTVATTLQRSTPLTDMPLAPAEAAQLEVIQDGRGARFRRRHLKGRTPGCRAGGAPLAARPPDEQGHHPHPLPRPPPRR